MMPVLKLVPVRIALLYAYLIAVAIPLIAFDASLLVTTLVFTLPPAIYVWRRESLSPRLLLGVGLLSSVGALIWETVAYTNGIWYELSSFDIRVFGLFPIEIFLWSFSYVFFILVMYEYFFDDAQGEDIHLNRKNRLLIVFNVVVLLMAFLYQFIFDGLFIPKAYATLLFLTIATLGVAAVMVHSFTWHVAKKALLFSLFMFPISVLHEYISIVNVHWIFANPAEYLHFFAFAGEHIPIEEIGFILVIPFWVVCIYELYLDDNF